MITNEDNKYEDSIFVSIEIFYILRKKRIIIFG